MNSAFLLGHLISDPVLQHTKDNRDVCRFRIATSNGKDKDGKPRPADIHYIVVWAKSPEDRHPENVANNLRKGRTVSIVGRISENKWVSKEDGMPRSRTEIIAQNIEFVGQNPKYGNGQERVGEDA